MTTETEAAIAVARLTVAGLTTAARILEMETDRTGSRMHNDAAESMTELAFAIQEQIEGDQFTRPAALVFFVDIVRMLDPVNGG